MSYVTWHDICCRDHCVLYLLQNDTSIIYIISPTERLEKVPDDVYEGCLHVDVLLAAALVPVSRLLVPGVPVPAAAVAVAVLVQAGAHHDVHQHSHLWLENFIVIEYLQFHTLKPRRTNYIISNWISNLVKHSGNSNHAQS